MCNVVRMRIVHVSRKSQWTFMLTVINMATMRNFQLKFEKKKLTLYVF
jgi:hypothetical protein